MNCIHCGGSNVIWKGPIGNLTHTECPNCGETNCHEPEEHDTDMDESMDGDFDSGMASAGFVTDEDYGYYGGNEDF